MEASSSQPILAQILHPSSPAEHITALRALKNDIIGHQQRKEAWVGHGILDSIVQASASQESRQDSKSGQEPAANTESLSEEETLRVQALSILGSLAYGGPQFIAPLHCASALPAILSNLCPSTNPPQLVSTALQALSNLTESTCLSLALSSFSITLLADSVFSAPHVGYLYKIFSQSSTSPHTRSQVCIAASLISKLCQNERHRSILANAGVLDALAVRLAEIIALQGLVIPGAGVAVEKDGHLNKFPYTEGSEGADLAIILECIAIIIADSKLRACQLIYSSAILAVFPLFPTADFAPNRSAKAAWSAYNTSEPSSRQGQMNAVDYLIPNVSTSYTNSVSGIGSAFPPLGTQGPSDSIMQDSGSKTAAWPPRNPVGVELPPVSGDEGDAEDPESPLVPYLIWLTRSSTDIGRLMAAYLLAGLYRAGVTTKSRELSIGLLIIPILVGLLERTVEHSSTNDARQTAKLWLLMERTPAVIAKLIIDSENLQKSAYDAGIISKLARMMKSSYEKVPTDNEARTWSSGAPSEIDKDNGLHASRSSKLGDSGFSALLVHKIKVRESVLRAIAALVPFKDEYRKSIVEQGTMPFIVESLKPHPEKPSSKLNDKSETNPKTNGSEATSLRSGFGINPTSVLIAACGAVRHLSRSVSILRTTLVDNGVVMPIFNLLSHSDIEVQIAATATACNIVTEFSPMRETISAAGVLKILCQHAHSANVNLRLNALWALKHLVQSAGNDIKMACVEELGQGWLVQLICEDTEDDATYTSSTRLTVVDQDNDVHMNYSDDEDYKQKMADNAAGVASASRSPDFSQKFTETERSKAVSGSTSQLVNSRFAALHKNELNAGKKARENDTAVQEQGLDLIRNLIGAYNSTGPAENSDMIDFLFHSFGQDQIFEILASKLRPKVINPFSKRGLDNGSGNGETRIVPPQPEIITCVEYILTNVAASVPRHRQQVVAQTELLKLVLEQSSHPDKEVRLALCWLVINLTWVEDDQDTVTRTQRVRELTKLGFLAKMEVLERDCDLDVRDRAKTALWQMKQTVPGSSR
ncbi:hypothetical protein V494_00296 [Pseudogymnoascus sp. VKM F-4513 (FW-928)]|nr:hypothetical protein V494_00296 [Pseudogymnoascus sp. VKM F-4513 (FW-928)]